MRLQDFKVHHDWNARAVRYKGMIELDSHCLCIAAAVFCPYHVYVSAWSSAAWMGGAMEDKPYLNLLPACVFQSTTRKLALATC